MAVAALSATEAALENQRLGGLQLRVAALCTLVQMCDGYDLNSVAWAVPSLIRDWHLPPSTFAMAFLWSSIGIMVGALSAGPIGDRFGRRPLLLASLTIFGIASLLSAVAGVARHAEPVAVLHWDRHRGWLFRCGRVDRRLRAAPSARDDDYGYVYRRAPGRLPRWADRGIAARGMGLAHDLRPGRCIPVGSVAGAGAVAAGIAAVSGSQAEFIAAQRRPAPTPRHHFGAERCR